MKKKITGMDITIYIILIVLALIIIFPFYNALIVSLVPQEDYVRNPFMFWPKRFDFSSYEFVLGSAKLKNGFLISGITTILGLLYSMFLTICTAYALSRKKFPGKGIILNMLIVTMYFSGGLIPFYILMRNLHLIDKIAVLILPGGLNIFYMLIMRNFMSTIPESITESAKIDGANELVILVRIILPLCLPVLATVGLFYIVDKWNDWFPGMLYIKSNFKQPLQTVLRSIIASANNLDVSAADLASNKPMYQDGVKMASVIVSMLPVMLIYPFVQRFFMKGVMLGAVKE